MKDLSNLSNWLLFILYIYKNASELTFFYHTVSRLSSNYVIALKQAIKINQSHSRDQRTAGAHQKQECDISRLGAFI